MSDRDWPDLSAVEEALRHYDATAPEREAMIQAAQTLDAVEAWEREEERARLAVCDAFYEATQDRNSRDNCHLVSVTDLRQMVARWRVQRDRGGAGE